MSQILDGCGNRVREVAQASSVFILERRRIMRNQLISIAVLCGVVGVAQADQVVLTATDTDSISTTGTNWQDNRLRAYFSVNTDHVDGFMKFDFTTIPDGSIITGMMLTTYHEEGFGNPHDDPTVRIFRVANDGWSRANGADAHPGLNEVLTPDHTGFPFGNLVAYDWSLDVNAANWAVDMTDDTLSLAMSNVNNYYSFVYWYGSDTNPAPPILTVDYIPGPGGLALLGVGAFFSRRRRR
jgi:hypothetical protein